VADPGRGCDQTPGRGYVVGVTEPAPEPTLSDIAAQLAALTRLVSEGFATANANFETQHRSIAGIGSKVAMMDSQTNVTAAGLAEHRGEFRNHAQNMQAFVRDTAKIGEVVGRMAEDVAGIKSDTAFVEGFNRDMHEALVRHIADPHAHPDAA
jgi:hypothetical protein